MGVDVVALLKVVQHLLKGDILALALKLEVAALSPHLGSGGNEYLHLSIGKDGGAYVAAVHHYASVLPHGLLLAHHLSAHKGEGCHYADAVGDLHGANLSLYVLAVEEGLCLPRLRIAPLGDDSLVEQRTQLGFIDFAVGTEEAVAQSEQGYGAIHGAGVNKGISYGSGQLPSHGALAA